MKTQIQKSDDSSQGIRPSSFGLRHWLVLLPLVVASLAPAQTVPPFINYQGKVADSAGVGLGTPTPLNRKVLFRIYDAAAAGTLLYTEEQTVTLSGGEFSVLIGQGIAFQSEAKPALDTVFTSAGVGRFLEITVDNGDSTINASDAPITPRQQITSTAYAFRARSADTVASGTDLTLQGSANYGLGWYGAGRPFGGTAIDGPVLYGTSGGALGSYNGTTQTPVLRWNAAGQVGIGSASLAGAAASTKLVLQGDDTGAPPLQMNIRGSTDTNKRLLIGYNTTSNYGSVQAYNGASTTTSLLLNPIGGTVGIGVTTVGANTKFHVRDSLTVTTNLGQWRSLSAVSGPTNAVVMGEFDFNGTNPGGQVAVIGGHNADLTAWAPLAINPGGGNVGIGTSSPGATLDVNGSVAISSVLNLPATNSGGTAGVISLGTVRIHGWANSSLTNFFAGNSAGNFTMSGGGNTGIGSQSLHLTTSGESNTAVGAEALLSNTSGGFNTGVGSSALFFTTTGSFNTATGYRALATNTAGLGNTGMGYQALVSNSTGWYNTAVGFGALDRNITGLRNTAIGLDAGPDSGGLSNTTCLGYAARATQSNMVRIGNADVTIIQGEVPFTHSSDRNLKENFVPVDGAEVIRKILGMELTSWNFIGHDKTKFRHYGPMAQDFFAAFGHDAVGTIGSDTTINGGDLSGILLSAVQELARKLEVKDAEVKALQKKTAELAAVQKRLAELEAQDKAREARLVAIEKQLLSSDKPAARTASLKQGGGAE